MDKQVKAGEFKSALEHYEKVGKNDGETTFTGTKGNDTVQGLGKAAHSHFIGVELVIESDKGGDYPVNFTSLGEREIDTLIGNEFLLGSYITSIHPEAKPFYVGNGNEDYAKVQNFTPGKDSVWLAGVAEQYKIESAEGNVRISTKERDLVAIIKGIGEDKQLEVFVNAYTDKILGDRLRNQSIFGRMYELHYSLLAGPAGFMIVGIAALLMCILAITGLLLWSGWRNLISGFKIKLNASTKRKNYDIHQVVGIIALIFLAFTGFTGFIWNFYEQTELAIYALTSTLKPPEVKSIVTGKESLAISEIIEKAIATIPEAKPSLISVPTKPDEVFTVYLKQPQDAQYLANKVEIDRYSSKVLHVVNSKNAQLGDL